MAPGIGFHGYSMFIPWVFSVFFGPWGFNSKLVPSTVESSSWWPRVFLRKWWLPEMNWMICNIYIYDIYDICNLYKSGIIDWDYRAPLLFSSQGDVFYLHSRLLERAAKMNEAKKPAGIVWKQGTTISSHSKSFFFGLHYIVFFVI